MSKKRRCPECGRRIKTADDVRQYKEYGCCSTCAKIGAAWRVVVMAMVAATPRRAEK